MVRQDRVDPPTRPRVAEALEPPEPCPWRRRGGRLRDDRVRTSSACRGGAAGRRKSWFVVCSRPAGTHVVVNGLCNHRDYITTLVLSTTEKARGPPPQNGMVRLRHPPRPNGRGSCSRPCTRRCGAARRCAILGAISPKTSVRPSTPGPGRAAACELQDGAYCGPAAAHRGVESRARRGLARVAVSRFHGLHVIVGKNLRRAGPPPRAKAPHLPRRPLVRRHSGRERGVVEYVERLRVVKYGQMRGGVHTQLAPCALELVGPRRRAWQCDLLVRSLAHPRLHDRPSPRALPLRVVTTGLVPRPCAARGALGEAALQDRLAEVVRPDANGLALAEVALRNGLAASVPDRPAADPQPVGVVALRGDVPFLPS